MGFSDANRRKCPFGYAGFDIHFFHSRVCAVGLGSGFAGFAVEIQNLSPTTIFQKIKKIKAINYVSPIKYFLCVEV